MGPKRQVQIDGSKETDPNRRVQINWSKKTEWSKLVQYGPKSNQKVSKWVQHNQVSWSSFYIDVSEQLLGQYFKFPSPLFQIYYDNDKLITDSKLRTKILETHFIELKSSPNLIYL